MEGVLIFFPWRLPAFTPTSLLPLKIKQRLERMLVTKVKIHKKPHGHRKQEGQGQWTHKHH